MLAYRHGYHAGNHADVLKHSVYLQVLNHLRLKGPFVVIDTHAGPGHYDLSDSFSQRLREHEAGFERVAAIRGPRPSMIEAYLQAVTRYRQSLAPSAYPGSVALALMLRRDKDRMVCNELHSTEVERLRKFLKDEKYVAVTQVNAFKGLLAHVPPRERRGVVMMDPSYELKTDYEDAVVAIRAAHRKFATGIYVLWYPVVRRTWVERMDRMWMSSGLRKVLRLELSIQADTDEFGMTGSGVYVVNPPFTLLPSAHEALEWLSSHLSSVGRWRAHWLVEE